MEPSNAITSRPNHGSHQAFLTAIERDLLAGDAQFPTGLKLLAALRRVLDDPSASIAQVTKLLGAEPLVTARILRLANCATFNPGGREVLSVDNAIQRVGFNMVRTAATAVAVAQMRSLAGAPHFNAIADAAWQRSVQLSVLARMLAPNHGAVKPDEAALCGLISDLGTFYLLQRASRDPQYSVPSGDAALRHLLDLHAPQLTARLVQLLDMPAVIVVVLNAWHQGHEVTEQAQAQAQALTACMLRADALLPRIFDRSSNSADAPDTTAFAPMTAEQADELIQRATAAFDDLLEALDG